MSTSLQPSPVDTGAHPIEPYLLTVDDFERMIQADVFEEDARVELWDGRIYRKMAKNHPHSYSWASLNATLLPLLPVGYSLWAECSVLIRPRHAPLPDLMILRGAREAFRSRRPEAADVSLLVEIADSSLKFDTGAKLAAYARGGVAAYWVLNLKDGVIHVYGDPIPAEGRYASVATIGPDGQVPFMLDGQAIALLGASDLL